jgi:organic hydroperoxide reductase OsmC/OhrA
MKVLAQVQHEQGRHRVSVSTNGEPRSIPIPPKATGSGSSVNGGELLFLALATCYCNDIYREAARAGIEVLSVAVDVEGEFGGIGEPARNIAYRAEVVARGASEEAVHALLVQTDQVAEIQNTLRQGREVRLVAKQVVIVE